MAHIHGINERGELFTIEVYRKDGASRLSYAAESDTVQSNQDTVAGWRDAAAHTWGLRRTITITSSAIGSRGEKEQVENLKLYGRRLFMSSRYRT